MLEPDERPWAERIANEPLIFIGTVAEIRNSDGRVWSEAPNCEAGAAGRAPREECDAFFHGFAKVTFEVELAVRGDPGATFEVEQGYGTDCRIPFNLAERWLYAGNFLGGPNMFLNRP